MYNYEETIFNSDSDNYNEMINIKLNLIIDELHEQNRKNMRSLYSATFVITVVIILCTLIILYFLYKWTYTIQLDKLNAVFKNFN